MANFKLEKERSALLVVDIQERLYGHVERASEVLRAVKTTIQGFKLMQLPIVVTEQYPEKMGRTLLPLREEIPEEKYTYFSKTSFSCLGCDKIKKEIIKMPQTQWVVVGIEAHVCILQTVRDLIANGKDVVVLNDGVTSRSIYDYSTAIAEIRDCGARVSSVETVLFELLTDSKAAEFKEVSQLIK